MSRRVITFDRGSKRRIQEIRWKPIQILSAILLMFLAIALCIVLAFWEASHYLVQPKTPQFEPAARMGSFVRIVDGIDPAGRGEHRSTIPTEPLVAEGYRAPEARSPKSEVRRNAPAVAIWRSSSRHGSNFRIRDQNTSKATSAARSAHANQSPHC